MITRSMQHLLGLLRRTERGVVAVEAALIIPLMVFFMIAMLETYHYFRMISIVDRAAFTVANGVAMQKQLLLDQEGACTSPNNLCTYARLVPTLLAPLPREHKNPLTIQMLESCHSDSDARCQTQDDWNGAGWYQTWGKQCDDTGQCQEAAPWKGLDAAPPPSNKDLMIVVTVEQTYVPFSVSASFWSSLRNTPVTLQSHAFYRPRFDSIASLEVLP